MRLLRHYTRWLEPLDRRLSGALTHVHTNEHVAAITFDDGPDPEFTPRLLRLLLQHGAKATFFMLGTAAERHPELVGRVVESGHAIGNHSWDHPSFPLVSGRERRRQIRACAKVLGPQGQRMFRPPYGHQNLVSGIDVRLLGYTVVTWNIVGMDWLDYDKQRISEAVLSKLCPGSIVVLHDALNDFLKDHYRDRGPMLDALEIIFRSRAGKFRFVTVPELISCGRPHFEPWHFNPRVEFLNQLQRHGEPGRRYGELHPKHEHLMRH